SCPGAPIECESYTIIPTFLGGVGRVGGNGGHAVGRGPLKRGFARAVQRLRGGTVERFAQALRFSAGWIDLPRHASCLRRLIAHLNPDVVHAMRIPFEGLLASHALMRSPVPLVLSVWGNDFTYFAAKYPIIRLLTVRALRRADGLHTDCKRDQQLGFGYGFPRDRPATVLPSAGGGGTALFSPTL